MTWTKDPDAIKDYVWDWSDWLADGETIDEATTVTATGVTIEGTRSIQGARVIARISGGTVGTSGIGTASATCHIVTSTGQEEDWTEQFVITNR